MVNIWLIMVNIWLIMVNIWLYNGYYTVKMVNNRYIYIYIVNNGHQ